MPLRLLPHTHGIQQRSTLLGTVDRPRLRGRPFPIVAFYSDGRQAVDERLQTNPDAAALTVDFRYLTTDPERDHARWIKDSDTDALRNRLVWVCARASTLDRQARALARSRHMVHKYQDRVDTLDRDRRRLFFDEQTRCDELERDVESVVAEAFTNGELYFRARALEKTRHDAGFASLLHGAAEEILPFLYPSFLDISVTPAELAQLLEPTLSGPSSRFMDAGLGLLELDAGKYVASCKGKVPTDVLEHVTASDGLSGTALLAHFSAPPYGYPADVTRACLAGLLRGGKIRIHLEGSTEPVTSVRDPGVRDLFTRERDLRRADILPVTEIEITARDRAALCRFFHESLDVELDRENDAIADAVFAHFPLQVRKLQQVESRLNRLPGYRELPEPLAKLRHALEECKRSRQVLETVKALKKHVDVVRDGLQHLGIVASELTDDAVRAVQRAGEVRSAQLAQLQESGHGGEVASAAQALENHLESERPWRDIASLDPHLATIVQTYQTVPLEWISQEDLLAQGHRAAFPWIARWVAYEASRMALSVRTGGAWRQSSRRWGVAGGGAGPQCR